jgi:large subunit ribosomal protein L29
MKAKEIRELSRDELARKVTDMRQELFNLRFQLAVSQLENTQKVKHTQRAIARLLTIQRQGELTPDKEKR